MKLNLTNLGMQFVNNLCDAALKGSGVQALQLVNKFNDYLKDNLEDDKAESSDVNDSDDSGVEKQ